MSKTPLQLGVIEPRAAIAAFAERGLLQPSFRWQDVWQHEHASRLAVAGVQREDVLAIFRDAFDTKFAGGGTISDFIKQVKPALIAQGFWGDVEVQDPVTGEARITRFDNTRLRLIFDTNVRQSYAAGQWRRIQEGDPARLLQYVTANDSHVRPEHRAWHNLVLRADDPWWQTHFPPNGWRCRCTVHETNQRALDRLRPVILGRGEPDFRFTAPRVDYVPYVNPYSGEVKAVPRGIDPGFGYNPGLARRDAELDEAVLNKALRSDAFSGAVMAAQAATDMPALLAARGTRLAEFVADAQAAAKGSPLGAALFTLAPVPAAVLRTLQGLQLPLASGFVSLSDAAALALAAQFPAELLTQVPALLAAPTAILRQRAGGALVYVVDIGALQAQRLYVTVAPQAALPPAVPARNLVQGVSRSAPAGQLDLLYGSYA